jgi:CRP-like cAMP-binding protein
MLDGIPVGMVERILYLKKLPAFAGLPTADLAAIAELQVERSVRAGEVLLKGGEEPRGVYLVLEGAIDCHRRSRFVGRVGPGGSMGGLVLFAQDRDGVQAVAATEGRVLELDGESLLDVLEDRFRVLHHVLRGTCRQLLDLVIRAKTKPFQSLATAAPAKYPIKDATKDLDLVERIFFLRSIIPFQRSSINALAELSRTTTQVRFPAGTVLWKAGELGATAYLILEGTVTGRVAESGVTFGTGPGAPLGASEMMAELPRWYDATAETVVVALQGSTEALLDVFEDNYEMARDYLALWARAVLSIIESNLDADGTMPF